MELDINTDIGGGFFDGSVVKNLPVCRGCGFDLCVGKIPGEGNATHSSTLAWEIPWTEEPGGLQSMGSQKELDMTSN